MAFEVYRDRAHLAAVVGHLPDVEIAELGTGDGPAALDLALHLQGDVRALRPHLVRVDHVQDARDHLTGQAVVGVVEYRDDPHAEALKLTFGDRRVVLVAEQPGTVVDDDEPDLTVRPHIRHDVIERDALVRRRGRPARIDEFLDELDFMLGRRPLAFLPLRRNGLPQRVIVTPELLLRGNPQVENPELRPVRYRRRRLPDPHG
ncbi:MAG TPA: hypothetical protein VL551_35045 [Actinospica sp.]|nr:hypothetical protein [Actinospica sp.]